MRFPISFGGTKNALVLAVGAYHIPAKGPLPKILLVRIVQKICLAHLMNCMSFCSWGQSDLFPSFQQPIEKVQVRTNSSSHYFDYLGNQEQRHRSYSHRITEVFQPEHVKSQRGGNKRGAFPSVVRAHTGSSTPESLVASLVSLSEVYLYDQSPWLLSGKCALFKFSSKHIDHFLVEES